MLLEQNAELLPERTGPVVAGRDHVLDHLMLHEAIEREGEIGGHEHPHHGAIEHRQMALELSRLHRADFHVDRRHAAQQARPADVEHVLLRERADDALLECDELERGGLHSDPQLPSDECRRRTLDEHLPRLRLGLGTLRLTSHAHTSLSRNDEPDRRVARLRTRRRPCGP